MPVSYILRQEREVLRFFISRGVIVPDSGFFTCDFKITRTHKYNLRRFVLEASFNNLN